MTVGTIQLWIKLRDQIRQHVASAFPIGSHNIQHSGPKTLSDYTEHGVSNSLNFAYTISNCSL